MHLVRTLPSELLNAAMRQLVMDGDKLFMVLLLVTFTQLALVAGEAGCRLASTNIITLVNVDRPAASLAIFTAVKFADSFVPSIQSTTLLRDVPLPMLMSVLGAGVVLVNRMMTPFAANPFWVLTRTLGAGSDCGCAFLFIISEPMIKLLICA